MKVSPYIRDYINPHVIEILQFIEDSFELINYEQHIDDIEVPMLIAASSTTSIASNIQLAYREHIYSVLKLQGITLADPYNERLNVLADILHGCCVLGTKPYTDMVADGTIPSGLSCENNEIFLCEILTGIIEISVDVLLHYIKTVSNYTVDAIKHRIPIIDNVYTSIERCKYRFKQCPISKEGVVVDVIKKINYFGYSPEFMLKITGPALRGLLEDVPSVDQRVNNLTTVTDNLILLVLGSFVEDDEVESKLSELTEQLGQDMETTTLLNVLINKKRELLNA